MAAPLEYWATMAQVIPIVGLAVVVEARALSSRWEAAWPVWLPISQSAVWASTLLMLGVGEWLAFEALRGRDVADWLPAALAAVVWYAFSILILGPALEFLAKGNARPLAYLFTRHPILRVRMRAARRASRKLEVISQQHIELLSKEESRLVDAVTTLDNARDGLDNADAAMRAAIEDQRAFMAQHPGVDVRSSVSEAEIVDMFEQTAAARVSNAESRAVVVEQLEGVRADIEEARRRSANALKQLPELEEQLRDVVQQRQEALRLALAAYPLSPSPEQDEAVPVAETQEGELAPPRVDNPDDTR